MVDDEDDGPENSVRKSVPCRTCYIHIIACRAGELCSAWDLVSVHMLIPAPVAFDMGRPAQLVIDSYCTDRRALRRSISQMYTDIHRLYLQVIITVV